MYLFFSEAPFLCSCFLCELLRTFPCFCLFLTDIGQRTKACFPNSLGFLAHSLKATLRYLLPCSSLTLTVKDMTFFWFSISTLPAATELHSLPDKLSSSFVPCPLLNSFNNEAKNPKESTKSLETPCNITSFGSEICQCTSNLKVCMSFNPKILPVQNHFITVHLHIDNFDRNTHRNT